MHRNEGVARTPELCCCLRFSRHDAAGQARLAGGSSRQRALPAEPSWPECPRCWHTWLPVSLFPLPSGACRTWRLRFLQTPVAVPPWRGLVPRKPTLCCSWPPWIATLQAEGTEASPQLCPTEMCGLLFCRNQEDLSNLCYCCPHMEMLSTRIRGSGDGLWGKMSLHLAEQRYFSEMGIPVCSQHCLMPTMA